MLSPKAKIMPLRFKDANDYLLKSKQKQFVEDWWEAKTHTPDGIISGKNMWDIINKGVTEAAVNYPFQGLQKLTYGLRQGELVTLTAGSGLGKSQFVRELIWHIFKNTPDNIGMMFMEESVKRSGLSIMSLDADKPLHIPEIFNNTSKEEFKKYFDNTLGTERLFFYDHFGSNTVDSIVSRIRYFGKVLHCKYVVLDHVSIIVSDQQNGDERRALDEIMTKIRTVVQELDICLIMVSHLRRPSTAGHEEGAATSLSQLRGSASIGQLSDIVIGLERNGQHDDERERHTTTVRVIKNRFSGLTGPACRVFYNLETGRLSEVEEEFE
jgi:twinkle protein